MKAGFIGLGRLGKAIAGRLISQGVELSVWNRTPSKAEGLDAVLCKIPSDVASLNEVIFLNLYDGAAVREVLSGPSGLLEGGLRGKLVIDTTTNHFAEVESFHRTLDEAGGSYLESPVLGSVVPAMKGLLAVVASGKKDAFDMALPYLEEIGKTVFFVGGPGAASKMKAINNLVLGSFMAALSEAVALGEASGIERSMLVEVLSSGAGNSAILSAKGEKLVSGDFEAQFTTALMHRDLRYALELASDARMPLFAGGAVTELFALAMQRGMDELDFASVIRALSDK